MKGARELAEEAATCIEDGELRGDQLRAYLAAFLTECAAADLVALAAERPVAEAHLEKVLGGAT